MSFGITFGNWARLGDEDQSIAAAASHAMGAIDNLGKISTEVSVQVAFNASATLGADIIVEREINSTPAYEATAGAPWTVPMPFLAGATYQRVITIPADFVGSAQIRVRNNQAATHAITVNVFYRQSTFEENLT
jgi:hypothetical protein